MTLRLSDVQDPHFSDFCHAFQDGERSFVLSGPEDAPWAGPWMVWSREKGFVAWEAHSTCDYQCRIGRLTEEGCGILDHWKKIKSQSPE